MPVEGSGLAKPLTGEKPSFFLCPRMLAEKLEHLQSSQGSAKGLAQDFSQPPAISIETFWLPELGELEVVLLGENYLRPLSLPQRQQGLPYKGPWEAGHGS